MPCSVVRTINGLGWIYSSRSFKALALSPVYRNLHRLAARSTAATLFQNREDMAFFERHRLLGKGTRRLIPGSGIDVDKFARARLSGPSRAELRQALGLGDGEVVITVTRLTRQKGIATLLEAAALVHEARPGVRFLLVGPRQSEGPLAISQAEIDRHARLCDRAWPSLRHTLSSADRPTSSPSRPNIAKACRVPFSKPRLPACRSWRRGCPAVPTSSRTAQAAFWFLRARLVFSHEGSSTFCATVRRRRP